MSNVSRPTYLILAVALKYAAFLVYKLGKRQTAGMVRGRIYQSVWNLAAFAVAAIAVAVVYNWFNNPMGFR